MVDSISLEEDYSGAVLAGFAAISVGALLLMIVAMGMSAMIQKKRQDEFEAKYPHRKLGRRDA
eukprot:823750-Rhodomonas_salina.4